MGSQAELGNQSRGGVGSQAELGNQGAWTLLFFVGAALLAFVRLDVPLQEPQEARYAEIPRQMLAEGKWLVPVLHGEPYLDKPPLLYWLVMASYSVFGVHDWAARLVPSMAAFLTIGVTYCWGRRVLGARGGLLAGMILGLSVRYVYLSRMLTMDTLLCLFVVTALAGAHLAVRGPIFRGSLWLASALACGLGLLTKGPVAVVLVLPPVFAFPFVVRDARRPRLADWLAYGAVAIGVALPWYLAVMAADPAVIDTFLWRHHVERFVTPFDHQEPFWFYVPGIVLGMLPWTLLIPPMVCFHFRRGGWPGLSLRSPGSLHAGASKTQPRPPNQVLDSATFFLIAFSWCIFFFSLAGCKRPGYVLPAMPLLALALGCFLDAQLQGIGVNGSWLRHGSRLAYAATSLALVLGIGSCCIAAWLGLIGPSAGMTLMLLDLTALLGLGWQGWRRGPHGSWTLCAVAAFAFMLAGIHEILPGYARKYSMREQVRPHSAQCADASLAVACYPRRWDSVSFYLGRSDVRVYTAAEQRRLLADLTAAQRTLLFVKSDKSLAQLLSGLPEELEFIPQGRQGTIRVGMVRPRGRERFVQSRDRPGAGTPSAP